MLLNNQQNQVFRFRRFSHKAYAAFNSLRREVTIGCIANRIADLQLEKSNITQKLCEQTSSPSDNTSYEDIQEELELLYKTNNIVFTLITNKKREAAAASFNNNIYHYLKLSINIIGGFFSAHKLNKLRIT